MAIAAVAFSRQSGVHNATSVAITRTVTAGDPVGVIAVGNSGVGTPTISDNGASGGNTYTAVASVVDTGRTMKAWLFKCLPTKSATQITADWGAANPEYPWIGVCGATDSSGVDVVKAAFQAGPTGGAPDDITTGTQAPSAQPGLAWSFFSGPGAMSPGSGQTFQTFGGDFPQAGVGYGTSWISEWRTYSSLSAIAGTASQGSVSNALSIMFMFTEGVAATNGRLDRNILLLNPLTGVLA